MKKPAGLSLCILITACAITGNEKKDYFEISRDYRQMTSHPDTFAQYKKKNLQKFDSDWHTCIDRQIDKLEKQVTSFIDYCDRLYADPDWKLKCFSEKGGDGPDYQETLLKMMKASILSDSDLETYMDYIATYRAAYEEIRNGNQSLPSWEEITESISDDMFKCSL